MERNKKEIEMTHRRKEKNDSKAKEVVRKRREGTIKFLNIGGDYIKGNKNNNNNYNYKT